MAIEEKLYAQDPDNDEFNQSLAATCSNLGVLYRHMKNYKEGEKYYLRSYEIREKRYKGSDDLSFNWTFAITTTNYAYLLACAGSQGDAERKMDEIVLPIKKRLMEENPESKKYQSSYASSLKDYGFILSCSDDKKKWDDANEIFLETIKFIEQHLTKDSKLDKAYEELMATTAFEYGLLLKKMGRKQEAITRFQQAIDIYQALRKDGLYYVHEIGTSALELAELLSKNKNDWKKAESAYQQALEFGEKIPKISRKYHQEEYQRTIEGFIKILSDCPENLLKIKKLREKLAQYNTEGPVKNI